MNRLALPSLVGAIFCAIALPSQAQVLIHDRFNTPNATIDDDRNDDLDTAWKTAGDVTDFYVDQAGNLGWLGANNDVTVYTSFDEVSLRDTGDSLVATFNIRLESEDPSVFDTGDPFDRRFRVGFFDESNDRRGYTARFDFEDAKGTTSDIIRDDDSGGRLGGDELGSPVLATTNDPEAFIENGLWHEIEVTLTRKENEIFIQTFLDSEEVLTASDSGSGILTDFDSFGFRALSDDSVDVLFDLDFTNVRIDTGKIDPSRMDDMEDRLGDPIRLGGDDDLNKDPLTAIPEPGTGGLILFAGILALMRRSRR
ncbi:MAG: PEP-CTERM sorting domain-containing protein [Verrucomicrobiota bacterium]